jgi:hypothetical protein
LRCRYQDHVWIPLSHEGGRAIAGLIIDKDELHVARVMHTSQGGKAPIEVGQTVKANDNNADVWIFRITIAELTVRGGPSKRLHLFWIPSRDANVERCTTRITR